MIYIDEQKTKVLIPEIIKELEKHLFYKIDYKEKVLITTSFIINYEIEPEIFLSFLKNTQKKYNFYLSYYFELKTKILKNYKNEKEFNDDFLKISNIYMKSDAIDNNYISKRFLNNTLSNDTDKYCHEIMKKVVTSGFNTEMFDLDIQNLKNIEYKEYITVIKKIYNDYEKYILYIEEGLNTNFNDLEKKILNNNNIAEKIKNNRELKEIYENKIKYIDL